MCGFTGFLVNEKFNRILFKQTLSNMTERISHRGPDDAGLWTDDKFGLGFGHRRLSVLDLSSKGHQPMFSNSSRYVLIYNGEIYNHMELRGYLESFCKNKNIIWKGTSDTETLLEGIELLGVEKMLNKTIGMFAFALWDKKFKELFIARDRMGEKPVYYGWSNNNFIFGSELHSIEAFHLFQNPICSSALNLYMRYLYVPAPYSIYKNIYKLEPGCLIKINSQFFSNPPAHLLRAPFTSKGIHLKKWWNIEEIINKSSQNIIDDKYDLINITKKTLHQSVKSQLISDVPLGSFLSGGIDSSLISSIMQIEQGSKLNTFTIGLKDKNFDESKYARKIARHLNTNHNEYLLLSNEVQNLIPSITSIYDEPFADSSQIPTAILSSFARKKVTVALSGDGGDELFGGYNRYFWSNRIWQKVAWLPIGVRKEIGRVLLKLPVPLLSNFMNIINRLFFGSIGISQFGDKVHKFARRLNKVENLDDLYFSLITEWEDSSKLVTNSNNAIPYFEKTIIPNTINTFEEKMMYLDSISYLPDDILCKVDRAAMSVGLETRIPMLDHRVVELSWRIPLHMKIYKNKGKLILKKILKDYIPLDLIERPKMGFGIPLAEWLRTSLKDFANDQLEHSKIKNDGYLDSNIVNQTWHEHKIGKRNWQHKIWAIIMFQSWLHKNKI